MWNHVKKEPCAHCPGHFKPSSLALIQGDRPEWSAPRGFYFRHNFGQCEWAFVIYLPTSIFFLVEHYSNILSAKCWLLLYFFRLINHKTKTSVCTHHISLATFAIVMNSMREHTILLKNLISIGIWSRDPGQHILLDQCLVETGSDPFLTDMMGHFFLLLATCGEKNIFAGAFEESANLCILSTSDTGKSLWIPAVAFVLFSIRGDEDFLSPKLWIFSEASLLNLSSN